MNLVIATQTGELVKSYDCFCSFSQDIKVINVELVGSMLLLPDGIRKIRSGAFSDIKNVTTVVVPKSVKYIESGAFKNIKKVIFSERVSFKGLRVEKGWDKDLVDLEIGDTITSVLAYCYLDFKSKRKRR